MKILGNKLFTLAMLLSGIRDAIPITTRKEGIDVIKDIDKDEFIIANESVVDMLPELMNYKNLVIIPDDAGSMAKMDDLKHIIKTAVGIEVEV